MMVLLPILCVLLNGAAAGMAVGGMYIQAHSKDNPWPSGAGMALLIVGLLTLMVSSVALGHLS
jgi:hypothetical protein